MRPIIGAIMGHARMQLGRFDEARAELAGISEELEDVFGDGTGVFIRGLCAEIAARVGSVEPAERLYAALEPHASKNASLDGMDIYLGSVSHFLGILAAALSRRDRAVEHLEAAVAHNEEMGARAHRIRSQLELGRLLERSGRRGAGAELVAGAESEARALGMKALLS